MEIAGDTLLAIAVALFAIVQTADGAALVFLWLFEALSSVLTGI